MARKKEIVKNEDESLSGDIQAISTADSEHSIRVGRFAKWVCERCNPLSY